MKTLAVGITVLLVASFLLMPTDRAIAGPQTGPDVVVKTDKLVYNPGDEVVVKVEFPFQEGALVELAVTKGVITQQRIFYTIQPLQDSTTTIKFRLPAQDQFYQYVIQTTVHGHNVYGETAYIGNYVPIFTKEGADKLTIGDLSIDKKEVRPGESVQLKFKVKDGTGNVVPWATAKIALCGSSLESPPPWGVITPKTLNTLPPNSTSGCVLLYNVINSSTDTLSLKLEIPNAVQPRDYKLNIWSYPFPYDILPGMNNAHESVDLKVSGDPVNPKEPLIFQIVQWDAIPSKNSSKQPPTHDMLTYGDNITFYSYEAEEWGGANILGNPQLPPSISALGLLVGKPAVPDVLVQVYIVDPYGKIVYNNKVMGDENGSFQNMTFPITKDLQRGVYEVYHNVTKDGNYVEPSGSIDISVDQFYVTNLQKFNVQAEGKSFHVYFQSIDVDASNPVLDQNKKSLSFDVQKLEGKYYNRHFQYNRDIGSAGCVKIDIEKPLLTGPFAATINGKQIDSCGYTSNTGIIGPIDENGKLTIIGTYVIPEFPVNLMIVTAIGLIGTLIAVRLKAKDITRVK